MPFIDNLFTTMTKRRLFPELNQRVYSMAHVEKIAAKERIRVVFDECLPGILGYLCHKQTGARKRTRRIIVIDRQLGELERTYVAMHEIAHHFLHIPISARLWFACPSTAKITRSKHDHEADVFALIALIPAPLMIDLDAVQYEDVDPAFRRLCERRKREVWDRYGC